jgi:PHS family inorganic phosphate transporter-like MFS transporter
MDISLDLEKAKEDTGAYVAGRRASTAILENETVAESKTESCKAKSDLERILPPLQTMTIRKNPSRYCGVLVLYRCGLLGLGLNNSTILCAIGYASSKNVYHSLYNVAVVNLILCVAGNIPGYWVSLATIDTIGRKPIQMASFIILTILFCVIGFGYHHLSPHALFVLYVLCQFFSNFGANSTTFIGKQHFRIGCAAK